MTVAALRKVMTAREMDSWDSYFYDNPQEKGQSFHLEYGIARLTAATIGKGDAHDHMILSGKQKFDIESARIERNLNGK